MFVSQVSASEKGRPKSIAAGDKDARRRAVWLTENGALSLEAGLADWKRAQSELAKRLNPEAVRRLALAGRRRSRER